MDDGVKGLVLSAAARAGGPVRSARMKGIGSSGAVRPKAVTCLPEARNRRTISRPTYPVAPVTSTVCISLGVEVSAWLIIAKARERLP